MNTTRSDTRAKRWKSVRQFAILLTVLASLLGCREVQSSPVVELHGEQSGDVVTVMLSNKSSMVVTVNRLFVPGFPDSSIDYKVVAEKESASPELGSAIVIDPETLPLQLDPGAFYGVRISAEDVKSAVGFQGRCANITLVYNNRRRERVYSKLDVKSYPVRVCVKQ